MTLSTGPSQRVLVVEDEPRMREILIRAVAEAGFEPLCVRSAEQALKFYDAPPAAATPDAAPPPPPQICILDLNLPGMDGLEFLSRLRAEHSAVQVIILTGFGSLDAAKAAIRHDVVDFLTKPCRLGDLDIALSRARRRLAKPMTLAAVAAAVGDQPSSESSDATPTTLEQLEQQHILAALARNQGNRAATAAELGISERTLYYRLARYQQQGVPLN